MKNLYSDICDLDVESGPCRASVPAWFYNKRAMRCEAFSYGGCDGNANRFHSEEQCERQCGLFREQGKAHSSFFSKFIANDPLVTFP